MLAFREEKSTANTDIIKQSSDKLDKISNGYIKKPLPCQTFDSKSDMNIYKDLDYVRKECNKNPKFAQDLSIRNFLNSGSCGFVYEGEIKKNMNKKVALKLAVSNKVTKAKRDKIVKREINIMNKLKNKNSITLYGIYEVGDKDNEMICIVMEFAKYGDLEHFQKLIQKKTFNETLLAYIAKQTIQGLIHCKSSNIVHLDVKHQNLLIDENLNVKLTDYSVSYEFTSKDKETGQLIFPLVGTSMFMAPEVLSKKEIKFHDANKVDCFSLGVLLYHLAFNSYPYDMKMNDRKNFDEIHSKIMKNELKIPELTKHSEYFRNFLKCLLNKKIENRISLEDALNHPWMKCAQNIFDEKEKIGGDLEKFLINLVTDNIRCFNESLTSAKDHNYNYKYF